MEAQRALAVECEQSGRLCWIDVSEDIGHASGERNKRSPVWRAVVVPRVFRRLMQHTEVLVGIDAEEDMEEAVVLADVTRGTQELSVWDALDGVLIIAAG